MGKQYLIQWHGFAVSGVVPTLSGLSLYLVQNYLQYYSTTTSLDAWDFLFLKSEQAKWHLEVLRQFRARGLLVNWARF